jgi:hypothetical protein
VLNVECLDTFAGARSNGQIRGAGSACAEPQLGILQGLCALSNASKTPELWNLQELVSWLYDVAGSVVVACFSRM